jgi:hypothetical protein
MLIDPATGAERAVFSDTVPGFFFSPHYALDSRRLSAFWGRPPRDRATWMFDLEKGTSVKLLDLPLDLLGWASGGRDVYAQEGQTLYRLDPGASRRAKALAEIPWPDSECIPAGARHPDAFVCAAFDFVSDVWMIENFGSKAP